MARTVMDKRLNNEHSGFQHIIDRICRGEYVLVLGSDIILDTAVNQEAHGDSCRFFLEKVISNNLVRQTAGKIETFPDLIQKCSLDSSQVRRWLFDELARTDFDMEDLNPDLVRVFSSKCFRIVLTTTFDPAVETLMNKVWGKGKYRIMNIFNPKDTDFDFRQTELLGDEYFDVKPTLYYVFGKADPTVEELKFVFDDSDTLECISRWLGSEAPARLMSYIDTKHLMVLGCNLKDWCFRFFWYAMRHKERNNLNNGDIALLLDNDNPQDSNLYNYLHNTIKVRVQSDARGYIKRLADALDLEARANAALSLSKAGGIFISYASEDFSTAWQIFTRLREAGLNVWLDNDKLKVSDRYDDRIRNAIAQCRVFIPLLTPTVAENLEAGVHRYYQDEWDWAAGENSNIAFFPIIIPNYNCKAPYHKLLPAKLTDKTAFN